MRVLLLNYEFPPLGGGGSPVSYEIARRIVQRGHSVSVVTMGFKGLKEYEERDGIKIFRISCWRRKKEICHPWEQLTFLIGAKKFLENHLSKNNYDVCHCHFVIPTGLIALWVKKKFSISYVLTSHGSDVPGFNPDRFRLAHLFTPFILKKICDQSSVIISPSNYLLKLIKKNIKAYPKDKLFKIPNGIDSDLFVPQKKTKTILSTGRLLPRKGFQYLIRAVSDQELNCEVHICGDGPMMNRIKNLATRSKTKIILHGWVDNKSKEFKDLIEKASVFVLFSEKENASISLLEAMSAGCAIITTNVSGCPETVGDSGVVISPRDFKQLGIELRKLLNNEKLLKKLQKKSRQKVLRDYSWDKIADRYIDTLKRSC